MRQLPLYHISAGTSVIARIFILFPLLDWLGVNYAINTLMGVLLSAIVNYMISDRLGFQSSSQYSSQLDIYYPEGLAPGLADSLDLQRPDRRLVNIEYNFLFSILIPAHNEEDCIEPTIQSISQLLESEKLNYEILVVNDNSRASKPI